MSLGGASFLFAGCDTNRGGSGIYALAFDHETGSLIPAPTPPAPTPRPTWIAPSPGGEFLFAVESAEGGTAFAFAVDNATGRLTPVRPLSLPSRGASSGLVGVG